MLSPESVGEKCYKELTPIGKKHEEVQKNESLHQLSMTRRMHHCEGLSGYGRDIRKEVYKEQTFPSSFCPSRES